MWKVTARGTEGRTYVYQVDAPDYAPEDAVWAAACQQHGQERKARGIKETLDIRPGSYSVELLCPSGEWHTLKRIMASAKEAGAVLSAEDIDWSGGQPVIDGMDAEEWLKAMSQS